MTDSKIENVIGALALAFADTLQRDAQAEAPEAGPAAAAVTLIGHVPGLSIERLRRALSLSHSGAVRLVDRLVAEGLAARFAAPDHRAVALRLTPLGETTCNAILSARQSGLASALAVLDPQELQEFGKLAAKVLRGLVGNEDQAYRICRLCNYIACLDCPVEAELSMALATPDTR
ncbi:MULTISPECIES: MarR family transcriptional regulator [unclassified Mesorhizobium]|uniref:MarR family winged helix-turn-helix transcriptional regulator n=1 Tax=unclassified Mesorhizobium TaxID=325217 RepID=UPI000FCADF08|nr:MULTISPECIES: MarR family transcriptional regulator [unclassified Mesorhizobium]TIT82882.1 MAG: MarR family transcriptional regulator [Mesorhizobium sp.]TGP21592.1 MarR family transcriptional regulator [Mesorhizobium sp. M1D.F.Ca.ET.231.01.1.1]TGP29693.1 MarR family transcriptional regulator [Mesorhizobium sp. M1D.F.Ca.ET.234.01.1.1]TGS44057.1 MarR family transcriptional regulator [Mesorhizobium sp. M1D.F.Ca.ET.184.01.1.1]TGS60077.1 MarR family transcriptional regulator [Mesorhizobium sp. M